VDRACASVATPARAIRDGQGRGVPRVYCLIILDADFPAVCTYSCVQGSCTAPNTCTCNGNWGGPLCDRCADGWSASDCQTRGLFEFSFVLRSQPSARKVAITAHASNLIHATATRAGLVRDAACVSLSSAASTAKFVGSLIAFELIFSSLQRRVQVWVLQRPGRVHL
jgi:hypothetical protein